MKCLLSLLACVLLLNNATAQEIRTKRIMITNGDTTVEEQVIKGQAALEWHEVNVNVTGDSVQVEIEENVEHRMALMISKDSATGAYVVKSVVHNDDEGAGLQKGDVVVRVNGTPLTSDDQLIELLTSGLGKTMFEVIRNNETLHVEVNMGDRRHTDHMADGHPRKMRIIKKVVQEHKAQLPAKPRLGVVITLDVVEVKGLMVKDVMPGSLGNQLGLQTGDQLLKLNGVKLERPDQIGPILEGLSNGDEVKVQILRSGKKKVLTATFEEVQLAPAKH